MTVKYKSDALADLHGMMADLHEAGGIDKKTMRHFDEGCLTRIGDLKANSCAPRSAIA